MTTPLHPLKRLVGTPTALLIGMGVAIGSGIFRTPGEVAQHLPTPLWILLVWLLGGVIVLMQGMVTAELATRFPHAGGEYVFLREAYGRFVAFFFGWAYTVFVVGGGAATIARALGDFAAELYSIDPAWAGPLAAAAIILTTTVNAVGLRAGANTQNVLTGLKIAALASVCVVGLAYGLGSDPPETAAPAARAAPTLSGFLAAFLAVLWSYEGTTDSVKMAEEIRDPRRAVPRAVIGSAAALTVLYLLFNTALIAVVPVPEMAGLPSVPGEAVYRLFGPAGRSAMLIAAILICLGSLSSTVLATVRVTFALARDGLTFRIFSRMSRTQAPVPALILVGVVAIVLAWNRQFDRILGIYFVASGVLFGLSYLSLIIFRLRDVRFPPNVYRCPAGVFQSLFLILLFFALAVNVAVHQPADVLYTLVMLAAFGALYLVWKRVVQN